MVVWVFVRLMLVYVVASSSFLPGQRGMIVFVLRRYCVGEHVNMSICGYVNVNVGISEYEYGYVNVNVDM